MKNFKSYVLLFIQVAIILIGCKKTNEPITKKDPVITWANPADISLGTALSAAQLNASSDVPGTFVYTPAMGVKLDVGTNQELKADFTPTNATLYNVVSKAVTINVNPKKDPVITWTNPADIILPTPLSAVQLNATADVLGTFTYAPAIGAVLNIGINQTLKVSFTPTDAANYNAVTKSVAINVNASGTVTDYDGNVYHTVAIGTQTWTVENLKVTHYRNGDPITHVTDNAAWAALTTEAYCVYDNSSANKDIYGALYNWYAVIDSRNIAPAGWHVPSFAEWQTLSDYLAGNSVSGGKLKEIGTTHWNKPNTGATNESGFTGLPCGFRDVNAIFMEKGNWASWWYSTSMDATSSYVLILFNDDDDFGQHYASKVDGLAVRCIKD